MRSLRDAGSADLAWKRARSSKEAYELRAGDEVLATLRWQRALGSLAEGEVAEGRWTFKRAGFWRRYVTVRRAGSEADLGRFEARWTGSGALTLGDGAEYAWEGGEGQDLVRFGSTGFRTSEATVAVEPGALALPDLPLLVVFGWYLLVMQIRDSAAA